MSDLPRLELDSRDEPLFDSDTTVVEVCIDPAKRIPDPVGRRVDCGWVTFSHTGLRAQAEILGWRHLADATIKAIETVETPMFPGIPEFKSVITNFRILLTEIARCDD